MPAIAANSRLLWRSCLLLAGLTAAAGCIGENSPFSRRVRRDPNVLVAYVACSLAPAIEERDAQFQAENAGKSVRVEADEPLNLVRRIQEGEVPDVLICPGDAEIGLLEREGYLDRGTRQAIGTLRLAIAVPASRPTPITSYKQLTSSRVTSITMSTPGITSPGTYGKHALERAALWSKLQDKLILQETPLGSLKLLAEGKADAGIIYDPCPRLYTGGDIPPGSVTIAAPLTTDEERVARIHVVVHKRSPNSLLAQRFVRLLVAEGLRLVPPEPEPPAEVEPEPQQQD
jgi:molybdate transport system substrate-binding protein